MRKPCSCIALAMLLAGCGVPPPQADTSHLSRPPAAWMQAAPQLPDLPACDKTPDPPACRAKYDTAERSQHVDTADKLTGLQGWVRKLLAKQ